VSPQAERNPIIQFFLNRFGVSFKFAIALVMLIYMLILVTTTYLAFEAGPIGILSLGFYNLFVSYFQVGAYLFNSYGKIIPGLRFILNMSWYKIF
jgi:hypothetical protein